MSICEVIGGGDPRVLLLCDHASNHVPDDIDLVIDAALLEKHIAVDIGAAPLTRALAAVLHAPAILATVSRLVIDLNRAVGQGGLIPERSDGHTIFGNVDLDPAHRIARFHRAYHATIEAEIDRFRPELIVAVHSFTPVLETGAGAARPWEVGILSNRDRRAADLILAALRDTGLSVGDNQPYSGEVLNATLDRHAEGNGIASFSLEIRNDQIADDAGVARWAEILAPIIEMMRNRLASEAPSAT
ncbi:N-formylglutamate amidohydrolase [Sphingomonas sp. AX6]|uniref:N-formylglutamate amidohydrolase n=1 Tax=Sphingomonas sp. AX6 TaxID=2653171 RepID=UPI0012F028F9|nr:N-formylglutamate amidohydrolase [Sphingomonas sp. AX6]VXC94784.1 N-formylglutamate amidohydrolase [Sphingomonas sp. AX6]